MHKKVTSLILSFLLLFSLMTPLVAAETNDIENTPYETAMKRLAALGILKGYEDGSFKPSQTITRAEFAAIAVRSLGLESTALGSGGNTSYKDLAATHWASGYVNLATAKGIIKGYPDETFRPDQNVTYAEAITMLVRVLGYEPSIETGTWPSNFLVKAAEIGVTNNVSFDQSQPATRGDIALFVNNSLDIDLMEQVGYGDEKTWEEQPGVTLLTEYLNFHELEEAVVVKTAGYSQDSLDPDEVEVIYESKRYRFTLVDELINDIDSFLGHEVTVFVQDDDDDNKIEDDEPMVWIVSTTNEKDMIAWDYIVNISQDNGGGYDVRKGGIDITLDAADDTFSLDEDAIVFYNHERVTDLTDMASDKIGVGYAGLYEVAGTLILNDRDEIIFMNMFNYDDPVVVTEVNVDDEKVKYFNTSDKESTLKLDGETYTIYRNGKLAGLEDIEQDDVLYIWELSDGSYALQAYSGKITGVLEEINADSNKYWDYSLVVDGKTIYVGPNFTLSLDENDTIDLLGEPGKDVDSARLSDLESMVGTEVTVYLGKYQEATDGWNYGRHIVNDVDAGDSTYFMVSDAPWSTLTSGWKYYIELINADDQEIVYELTEDDTEFNGVERDLYGKDFRANGDIVDPADGTVLISLPQGALVDVEFNQDGTISEIQVIDDFVGETITPADINDDYDRIRIGGNWYYVTEGTALFDATNNEAVDWNSLEDVTFDLDVVAAQVDDKELEALVVTHTTAGTIGSSDYGLVLKRSVTSSGLYVTLAVEGQVGEYYAGDLSSSDQNKLVEGSLVKFTASDSDLDDIELISKYPTGYPAKTNPSNISTNEFDAAHIIVKDETATVVQDVYNDEVNLYLDIDTSGDYNTGDTHVGTWNSVDETFNAQPGFDVIFTFNKFEIASGGVDLRNGVIEVFVSGLDEDEDPTYFIDVDKRGEDSFYYDIDISHLSDPNDKVLSMEDLNDGDIINIYDVNDDGIYDYIVVADR